MTREAIHLYRSYFIGFALSFVLTVVSFGAAISHLNSDKTQFSEIGLAIGLVVVAIVQLVVQLVFFFHLGREAKPRLNTVSFLFMLMVVGIIGFGSLWIMYNLNYNMMPADPKTYIEREELITPKQTEPSR